MLVRKEEMKKDDLLLLLNWILSGAILSKNNFKYDQLLIDISKETCDIVNIANIFDDLIYESYLIYEKIKYTTKEDLMSKYKENPVYKILPESIIDDSYKNMTRFKNLYEDIIINSKFEKDNISEIQINILSNIMSKFILDEEYEKCAEIKNKINSI